MSRKINEVKNKKIKNVKSVEFLAEDKIKITFPNDEFIILESKCTDYGGETAIFITQDTALDKRNEIEYDRW